MIADGLIGGRYRLHEQVGSGGMGVVWRATDELLDRPVAIKRILLKSFDPDPPELTRQRMFREARIAAKLHHPHIVSIFDVLTVNDEPWLVLEYLPSESLTDVIGRGALPPHQVAVIGMQIADALAAAHAKGIVHRDIKPGNVLLGTAGEVKLTDFGISRATGDMTLTTTGLVTGTPGYLSPELCRGEQGGTASDIYSLGATLYAAVEGAPPFGDSQDNVLHLIRRIASQPAPPPKHAGPLTPVFGRLLDSEPAARPDAVTVRDLLRRVAYGPVIPPTTVIGPSRGPAYPGPPPSSRNHGRRRWLIAGAAIAALALTATLVIVLGRTEDSTAVAPTPSTQAAAPPTTAAAPTVDPALKADPPTADPCSLMDPAPLAAYGAPDLGVDFGQFSACQVDVRPASGGVVIVVTDFYSRLDPNESLPGTVEIRGDIGIGREPESDGFCQRTILLPDRIRLVVSARNDDGAAADVCAIAETATETALAQLTTTGIGQRPAFADSSLALLDACALLDPGALTAAGVDPSNPAPDYGNWYCEWGDTPRVTVSPDRQDEIEPADGTPTAVAGRTVLVLPGGYRESPDTCLAQVLHRRFLASNGEQRVETLRITFAGTGTPDELCRITTDLATNAVPRLPAIP